MLFRSPTGEWPREAGSTDDHEATAVDSFGSPSPRSPHYRRGDVLCAARGMSREVEARLGGVLERTERFYSNNCNYLHTDRTAVVRSGVHWFAVATI